MDDTTRARIRHLYFVEQCPLRKIGQELALATQAVRAALVLPGGRRDERAPSPVVDALAADAPAGARLRALEGRR
jgi:hypothetical protein